MPLFQIAKESLAPVESSNFTSEKGLQRLVQKILQVVFSCRLVASALLIFCAGMLGGCDNSKKLEERQTAERKRAWDETMNSLAKKHGAEVWTTRVPDRRNFQVFSVDVSRALMPTNGQSILAVSELEDVLEKDGIFTARFNVSPGRELIFVRLHMDLVCTAEQARRLMETESPLLTEFAVIAKIARVARPRFGVSGDWDGEMTEVKLDASDSTFLATGACIDFVVEERRSTGKK